MVYEYFDKKSKGGGTNNEIKRNQQLDEELHKPNIKKLKKDNIWGYNLDDMQLISKFNKGIRF